MQKATETIHNIRELVRTRLRTSQKWIAKHRRNTMYIVGGLVFFAVLFLYFYIFRGLPSPQGLKNYKVIPLSTEILDRNGKLLYDVYKEENRTVVSIKDIPDHVKWATISIEDKDFYKHSGVSFFGGMVRALKDTFILRKGLQGGSTLTQQLVKSALLSPERTVRRKIREIILALWTEQILSKDQILELYLNQVPYGGSSYGIEQASKTYFGKNAKDMTLAQAALLAGLPRAPSVYSPYANPALALQRRNEVLNEMYKQKHITLQERDAAKIEPLGVIPFKTKIKAPHFVFYVKSILEKKYGASLVEEGGLKVYTTLDLDLQASAEAIISQELDKVKRLHVTNGGIVATRPATGEILAMVGSVDYFGSASGTFNVTTTQRQPGSSIKPINYAIGIDRKLVTAASTFLDEKTCFPNPGQQPYCPVNYDNRFHGPVQLRQALANSYNIPAVKMLAINGIREFVASSSAFLIDSFKDPSRYGLSLTLGGGEVSMIEMSQAFSAFANEGVPRKLVPVLKVVDKNNTVLYEYKDTNFVPDITKPLSYPNFLAINGKRAISAQTAFIISHILLDNNARSGAFGPSSQLNIKKHKGVSVKTGTTNDKRDNWTIGYTPNFLVTVWVGNNDNSTMNQALASGITGAAPIWNRVMTALLDTQPDLMPRKPDGVEGRQVCTDTGYTMSRSIDGAESCPSRFEYLIKGTENVTAGLKAGRETIPVSRDTGKQTTLEDPAHEMQEKTVIRDAYSSYCVDCFHEPDPNVTPTPAP